MKMIGQNFVWFNPT